MSNKDFPYSAPMTGLEDADDIDEVISRRSAAGAPPRLDTNVGYADLHGAAVVWSPEQSVTSALCNHVERRGWRRRHAGVQQAGQAGYFAWFDAAKVDIGKSLNDLGFRPE